MVSKDMSQFNVITLYRGTLYRGFTVYVLLIILLIYKAVLMANDLIIPLKILIQFGNMNCVLWDN